MHDTNQPGRPPNNRVLRVLRPVDHKGTGIIHLAVQRSRNVWDAHDYSLTIGPAYGGEALGVELRKDDGETYHVCLTDGPEDSTCDCKGFLRHCHCKHLDALRVMLRRGLLAPPAEVVIDLGPAAQPADATDQPADGREPWDTYERLAA